VRGRDDAHVDGDPGQWESWWIYWIGPLLGTFLAILCFSFLAKRIEVAKLYHFETVDDRLARRDGRDRSSRSSPETSP
jgi:hypothetical protein